MPRTPDTDTPPAGPPAEDLAPAPTFSQRAAGLAELVREHPRTAIVAGAVVAAGAAVAAAIPLARRARADGAATTTTKTSAKKKT